MQERIYVTKHNTTTADIKLEPEIVAGPFYDQQEAELNCPDDDDQYEYMVEHLTDEQVDLFYR